MAREELTPEQVEEVWIRFRANKETRAIAAERPPVAGFFDELFEGWSPRQKLCPWLESGLYVNRDGQATACCMVKDTARFGFGTVGVDPMDAILAKREAMRAQLADGEIPTACRGCDIAHYSTMSLPALMKVGMKGVAHRYFGRL
jgi:hypothetical protein